MRSPTRRAFLSGRRLPASAWDAFCAHMRRSVEGTFLASGAAGDSPSARLLPRDTGDVRRARTLCVQHGVKMYLDGVPGLQPPDDQPALWVVPGRDMAVCQLLDGAEAQWFVQPGCLVGELEALGLPGFSDAPAHMTVAAWLADRGATDWPNGRLAETGLSHLALLLGDGEVVQLGPFGVSDRRPLEGRRMQALVSELFRLSATEEARACMTQAEWPGRFRLDALTPDGTTPPNLAHLLWGHGGGLGWIEWMVFDGRQMPTRPTSYWLAREHPEAAVLDMKIKNLFDPDGLFPIPDATPARLG